MEKESHVYSEANRCSNVEKKRSKTKVESACQNVIASLLNRQRSRGSRAPLIVLSNEIAVCFPRSLINSPQSQDEKMGADGISSNVLSLSHEKRQRDSSQASLCWASWIFTRREEKAWHLREISHARYRRKVKFLLRDLNKWEKYNGDSFREVTGFRSDRNDRFREHEIFFPRFFCSISYRQSTVITVAINNDRVTVRMTNSRQRTVTREIHTCAQKDAAWSSTISLIAQFAFVFWRRGARTDSGNSCYALGYGLARRLRIRCDELLTARLDTDRLCS